MLIAKKIIGYQNLPVVTDKPVFSKISEIFGQEKKKSGLTRHLS
jgi:hypothetical protein